MKRGQVFRDNRVHIQRRMCSTCIFRPGNRMDLRPNVVEQMVAEAHAIHGSIPCHETLDGAQSICHGFYKLHPTPGLRLAQAIGVIAWHTPR